MIGLLSNPWAILVVAATIFLSGLTSGIKLMSWKHGAQEAARITAEQKAYATAADRINAASDQFEVIAANLQKARPVIEREVRREIEKPVYRDCVVPPSGLLLYRNATEYAAATGQPVPALPAPR